ncbi:DNA polymerase III subunit gamma/tau [Marinagarivorans algicola]|uniref:DNA polymerase III subunit gamma/tau n=1 Tax=Marinagarivorans algicola TaxID=1513270 RepID=UPI0006B4EF60|nr:DNA polymerase III subunit gamma/tau [Marinagarivorans algicola]
MSYQVLARKWRPRIFREMVGQEHVLRALINALDHNRLHHAYLFTGTRGVGKTTIARILAKCFNCEVGVSSEPCGECSSCLEIAQGRFVDLIEVDAASRTRVEDTRELLDNVQYAPTRGRYKIYLIDEVHMLSTHSFNALLKTLEEPPEHVKFLLATTDPQKLPVTILSRCLQFNLKNMSPERIVAHLQFVLGKEGIPFDESALWQLARSADGSMRDALSLTDQAIAFGAGKVADTDVVAMLGTIDHQLIEQLIRALIANDGPAVLKAIAAFSDHAPDYFGALGDLITFLHRIAIAQAMPEALDNSYGDRAIILELCQMLPPEDVQLFYQTALIGRRDLNLSPEPRAGLEMILLRMLAFKPQGIADVPTTSLPMETLALKATADSSVNTNITQDGLGAELSSVAIKSSDVADSSQVDSLVSPANGAEVMPPESTVTAATVEQSPEKVEGLVPNKASTTLDYARNQDAPASSPAPPWELPSQVSEVEAEKNHSTNNKPVEQGVSDTAKKSLEALLNAPGLEGLKSASQISAPKDKKTAQIQSTVQPLANAPKDVAKIEPGHWLAIYDGLGVKGVLQSTVANCLLVNVTGNQLYFLLDQDKGALFDDSHRQRFNDLLNDYFGEAVKVHIDLAALDPSAMTPAIYADTLRQQALANAVEKMKQEPLVKDLQEHFNAVLDLNSVVVEKNNTHCT